MEITRDDIRAAVAQGVINDTQAIDLVALAEARAGIRERISGHDEPFELFSGFNEVFIILGMGVIFFAWFGFSISLFESGSNFFWIAALGLIGMISIGLMARYFTLKRRMNGPSSMLAALYSYCAGQVGLSFALANFSGVILVSGITASVVAVAMFFYWLIFRVPFALFLISSAVFVASFCFIAQSGDLPKSASDFFILSASGLYGWITILLGFVALGFAMAFDMSDPNRVTRGAINGFWLHVIAAPAIVNTVAVTLFMNGSILALLGLTVFLLVLMVFALVIDRRSFLIAGAAYMVGMGYQIIPDMFFTAALILGIGLVVLGSFWERLRSNIMTKLPDFPCKKLMPPWQGGTTLPAESG